MTRKTPEERLAETLEQERQVKEKRKQLEARVRADQKKAEARKFFLFGELAWTKLPEETKRQLVDENVTDPELRKLFGF